MHHTHYLASTPFKQKIVHSASTIARTFTFVLAAFSALTLTGCGESTSSVPSTGNNTNTPIYMSTHTHEPVSSSWVWGVTTDNSTINTTEQVNALGALSERAMLRTVFDYPRKASDYAASITELSTVATIMASPIDAVIFSEVDIASVNTRIQEYLNTLGKVVDIWEIGNEINGDWMGNNVIEKIEVMYDAVKAKNKKTALTLYYEPTPDSPDHDMITWVEKNIPVGHRLRTGIDYVWVSYFEDENEGHALTNEEVTKIFTALTRIFPNAKLGFGECGWGQGIPESNVKRGELIHRFYDYRIPSVPNYVGGGFYWHFRNTMTPRTQPDWTVLNQLINTTPVESDQ